MKLYIALISDERDPFGWEEQIPVPSAYSESDEKAAEYIEDVIKRFNDSLRPGEVPRTVEAVILSPNNEDLPPCRWEKKSLVSKKDGSDDWQCTVCKAIANRPCFSDRLYPKRKLKKGCRADLSLR